jgi:hypothetical protein
MSERCDVTWGNCGISPTQWGKPTETPHVCMGAKGHKSKLHACGVCGVIGHRVMPHELSRAGRELKELMTAMREKSGAEMTEVG